MSYELETKTSQGKNTDLDLDKVDWLHNSGLSCELTSIQSSAGCGDNLATTTVNSICMQGHIMDVEANGTHVLFTEDTLKTFKQISMNHWIERF